MENKKTLVDYHIHTEYSFDYNCFVSPGRVFDMCEAALKNGLSQIALTDHYDINTAEEGTQMGLDFDQRRDDIMRAKKAYEGRLEVLHGVELGQPHQVPEKAAQIIDKYNFDFVIGSYHNNINVPDFSLLDYQNTAKSILVNYYRDYLNETVDHVKWGIGRISTLGHIGYPLRYLVINGLGNILNPYDEKYLSVTKEIFNLLIKHDIALEVNTSGWRQGVNDSLPFGGMVQYYLDMGGKLITVGSDCHNSYMIGSGIEKQYGILHNMGVRERAVIKNGNMGFIKI